MSRVGKKAVAVPSGVTANVEGQTVMVLGDLGAKLEKAPAVEVLP